jgi:hypothetical protein
MTRSTLSPVRRFVAALALAGVAGLGAVAVAPTAYASDKVAEVKTVKPLDVDLPEITGVNGIPALPALLNRPNLDEFIQSPLPDAPITFKLKGFKITLPAEYAQRAQTVLATLYDSQGYPVVFDSHGRLVIGKRTCDDTKSKEWNKGCVKPATDSRF